MYFFGLICLLLRRQYPRFLATQLLTGVQGFLDFSRKAHTKGGDPRGKIYSVLWSL